ncbi:MAG: heme exporter protein CcmD [Alphaproteobacteria bacterium]|nr:heme exporter protein CcmD [Alphaproteobacteria bacterium]
MSALLNGNYGFFIISAYLIFTVTLSFITLYSLLKLRHIKRQINGKTDSVS